MRALLLHNIRSAHNVGSLFRTADGAGIAHIYISGYTPTPLDRFKRPQKDIAKTALGAEALPWTYTKTPEEIITLCRAQGFDVVGIEQDARAIDYRAFKPQRSTLYILGSEVEGMSPELRSQCDVLLEIPLLGTKESLNVAIAAGIVLFAHLST